MANPSKMKTLPPQQSKSQALDDLIMGTNSSSITSKRSVERFYYPNEAHFFRHFVHKFQRRAPLINRGYWLRLRAIDVIVHKFLKSSLPGRKKVIVNLGCGSDVLPWQCHTRYSNACENTVFVDIDYPDLMKKKRDIVLGTPQLRDLLGPDPVISDSDTDPVLLCSDKYCQVACDLKKLDALRKSLGSFLTLSECSVLFVAEVSITYMDTASADSLIEWASSIGHAQFCLLEQILPNGPDHPFARTMLSHFNKLNTPLKSVHQYPTLNSQRARFQERKWQNVELWDLWEVWNSDYFISSFERIALDEVEPFDEWEEFVLFARHYFIMHAKASQSPKTTTEIIVEEKMASQSVSLDINRYAVAAVKRRFGASVLVTNFEGQHYAMHTFGIGTNGRIASYDIYSLAGATIPLELPPAGPSARMCHTLTDLGSFGVLLTGGRGSPTTVYSDCWIFKKDSNIWEKIHDLPTPLFRHSVVRLKGSSLALVFGGKMGPSRVSSEYFMFHPSKGWLKCVTSGSVPDPVFGAIAATLPDESQINPAIFQGIFSGGMTRDGTINSKAYRWRLDVASSCPSLHFEALQDLREKSQALSVFGAQVAQNNSFVAICGGVGHHPTSQGQDMTLVSVTDELQVTLVAPPVNMANSWPLLIGSSTVSFKGSLVIVGGGITCFSMGTFWETSAYSVDVSMVCPGLSISKGAVHKDIAIRYLDSPKVVNSNKAIEQNHDEIDQITLKTIPRIRLSSDTDFQEVLLKRRPVIIEGLNFGGCVETWTPDNLVHRLGEFKQVVVHECQIDTEKMDFNSKNFRYVTELFGKFMAKANQGQRLYLRSLSGTKPSASPANINDDFPPLADDCHLPEELRYVKENLFSSVLRISGRVNMWLHYDVMANVYTQVRGSKRMVLFPPTDVSHLAFAPGASSSSLDVFSALEKHRLLATHPYEADLRAGDALFLPSMWFHTATPTTDLSVAVNFFFRDLDSGYSLGRDVYGNRDLAAYEKGRHEVARIVKGFERVPSEIRQFYLARLSDELLDEQAY